MTRIHIGLRGILAIAIMASCVAVSAQDKPPSPATSSADAAADLYAYLYPDSATTSAKPKDTAVSNAAQFDDDTTRPWTPDELQSLQTSFKSKPAPDTADKAPADSVPVETFKVRPDGSIGPVTLQESPYRETIVAAANTFHIDPNLAHYVIEAESRGNPKARSPKGAGGLMQLMPGTATELGVRDRYNVTQNIYGGVSYLSQLLNFFGRTDLALAAYNAGPSAVQRYGGIPPYSETRNYVKGIMSHLPATAMATASP